MNKSTLHQVWAFYLEAYSDIAPAERERLLRKSVSDDVVFTNPNGEGRGLANLLEHIRQFQEKSPGAYFKSNELLAHHGQLLSKWTMHKWDGSEIATAHTFARTNEQGQLTNITGFFKA